MNSKERMTGLSQEERVRLAIEGKRKCLNNTVDILREQKKINKQRKNIQKFMSMLYKTGRVGKG